MHAETMSATAHVTDPTPQGFVARVLAAAWRFCTNSTLLLVTGLLTLVLVLTALLLPQLPNNLQSSSAAATRWLMAMGAEFGAVGGVLRTLGLFNLLHSPIYILLLAGLIFLLAMQLARQVGVALALRQIPAIFATPRSTDEPLALPPMLDLFRRRVGIQALVAAAADAAEQSLATQLGDTRRETLATADAPTDDSPDPTPEFDEVRLLAVRHLWAAWLRPVLVLGLLVAVTSLWLNAAFGWEVLPDTLAPGGVYRYPPRNLEIAYLLDEASDTLAAGVRTRLGGAELIVPIEPAGEHQVGSAVLLTRAQTPGLVVQTTPADVQLALPGEPPTTGAVGFSFPQAGSEQSLLLPDAAMGVRLVRGTPSNGTINPYMLEVYESGQAAAMQRELVDVTRVLRIEVDGTEVTLQLTPAPAVDALVRYQPLDWLAWVGLALVLAGLPGFLWRPRFALAQLTPLQATRTQFILQSNHRRTLESVVTAMTKPDADAAPAGKQP